MSSTGSEFEQLMERIRAGDAEAARELYHSYGKAIQLVVRRRLNLNRRMRSEFDSVDFVQEVWAAFFRTDPEHLTFRTPEQLAAFLLRLLRNKLVDAYRLGYRTEERNPRKMIRYLRKNCDDMPAPQPTPSQLAVAEEEFRRLLWNKPPKIRSALEMLRAGCSRQEIAQKLGLNPKMIQRLLQRLDEQRTREASPHDSADGDSSEQVPG